MSTRRANRVRYAVSEENERIKQAISEPVFRWKKEHCAPSSLESQPNKKAKFLIYRWKKTNDRAEFEPEIESENELDREKIQDSAPDSPTKQAQTDSTPIITNGIDQKMKDATESIPEEIKDTPTSEELAQDQIAPSLEEKGVDADANSKIKTKKAINDTIVLEPSISNEPVEPIRPSEVVKSANLTSTTADAEATNASETTNLAENTDSQETINKDENSNITETTIIAEPPSKTEFISLGTPLIVTDTQNIFEPSSALEALEKNGTEDKSGESIIADSPIKDTLPSPKMNLGTQPAIRDGISENIQLKANTDIIMATAPLEKNESQTAQPETLEQEASHPAAPLLNTQYSGGIKLKIRRQDIVTSSQAQEGLSLSPEAQIESGIKIPYEENQSQVSNQPFSVLLDESSKHSNKLNDSPNVSLDLSGFEESKKTDIESHADNTGPKTTETEQVFKISDTSLGLVEPESENKSPAVTHAETELDSLSANEFLKGSGLANPATKTFDNEPVVDIISPIPAHSEEELVNPTSISSPENSELDVSPSKILRNETKLDQRASKKLQQEELELGTITPDIASKEPGMHIFNLIAEQEEPELDIISPDSIQEEPEMHSSSPTAERDQTLDALTPVEVNNETGHSHKDFVENSISFPDEYEQKFDATAKNSEIDVDDISSNNFAIPMQIDEQINDNDVTMLDNETSAPIISCTGLPILEAVASNSNNDSTNSGNILDSSVEPAVYSVVDSPIDVINDSNVSPSTETTGESH